MRFLPVWQLSALLVAIGGGILFCFDPYDGGLYPVCLFHQTTGLLCPGCGSLRAVHQLLHGHVLAAFELNPLLLLCLPLVAWHATRYVSRAQEGGKTNGVRSSWGTATTDSRRSPSSPAGGRLCNAAPEDGRTPLPPLEMAKQPLPIRPLWFWLFLAAALAFTVWRNLPGFPIPLPPS